MFAIENFVAEEEVRVQTARLFRSVREDEICTAEIEIVAFDVRDLRDVPILFAQFLFEPLFREILVPAKDNLNTYDVRTNSDKGEHEEQSN